MNKNVKKIVLIIAATAVLGNVIYFSDSKIAAPEEVNYQNDHYTAIEKEISAIQYGLRNTMDSHYYKISDQIDSCHKEGFITDNERDELLEMLVGKYLPWFIETAENRFNQTTWEAQERQWILSRVKLLKSLTIQSGNKPLISGESNDKLTKFVSIIELYEEALAFANKPIFSTLDRAKEDIATAEKYANDSYLKKCKSLVSMLERVKLFLGAGHFQHLQDLVDLLDHAHSTTEKAYDQFYKLVLHEIREYNANAFSTYGEINSTSYLASAAQQKYKKAMAYYESKKIKTISYPSCKRTGKSRSYLIRKISYNNQYTKIEISYIANPGDILQVNRGSYIRVGGFNQRYYLQKVENIPYKPNKKVFNRADIDYRFTLYFQPIPYDAEYINCLGNEFEIRDIHLK